MASIKDVAQAAGVSASTVSHVINKTRFVAPATREKVERAVAELGFSPSHLARALKVNKTRSVGMLVSRSTNPFFAEVVRGLEEGCYRHHYSLILCNSGHHPERQLANLNMLVQRRIDALVVMTNRTDESFLNALSQVKTLPKIILDSAPHADAVTLQDDSITGARLATAYLIDQGHRDIGILAGPDNHPRSAERRAGFEAEMKARGLDVHEEWCIHNELTINGGYDAMRELLARPSRPTAIFAFNDLMAIGAYRAIAEAGLRVPDDISVIGYDNIEYAGFMFPPLTTIEQPSFEMGLNAASMLIDHLENSQPMPDVIQLDSSLVVRQSVGAPKPKAHPA